MDSNIAPTPDSTVSAPATGPSLPAGLFWVLLSVLLVPAGIFISMSYLQLENVLIEVKTDPPSAVKELLDDPDAVTPEARPAITLEYDIVMKRHQRTTAFIATRTWMRFMSLIFGSLMVTVGAAFVLGRVAGPVYEASAGGETLKGTLKSTSPGLFLIASGLVLIAIPNLSSQSINTVDTATYYGSFATGGPHKYDANKPLSKEEVNLLQNIQNRHKPNP